MSPGRVDEIRIAPFVPAMTGEAARLLARAFVTNPLHVAAFGGEALTRNESFFRVALPAMRGPKWVALDGHRLVGLVHWIHAPGCEYSGMDKLRLLPAMMGGFGPRPALRVVSWLGAWARSHPRTAHGHLGPIGVDPEFQGRGIGRRLMERYCADLAERRASGYLETDRPENVTFYRGFGFELAAEAPVLGVPSYYMSRAGEGLA